MSAKGVYNPTLSDVVRRLDPSGKLAPVVEILNDTNEILQDMTAIEANGQTSHKTVIRSGLPDATWRQLNYGVQPSKSRSVAVSDTIGLLEAYAEIDKQLYELNGAGNEFRLSEDRAFLESMNQTMASALFYGNTETDPEKFMGLAPRYDSKSAENGGNIIDGGGTGSDNTSIWLLCWSPNTLHSIYPKGSPAGLNHKDLGETTKTLADGSMFQVLRTHYKWLLGLSLRDWRYCARVANIDVSDLTKTGSTGADLCDLIVQAIECIPNINFGRTAIYCNKTIRSFLRRQINNKSNVWLSESEVGGKQVLNFAGIPVRRCDAILNTETAIS